MKLNIGQYFEKIYRVDLDEMIEDENDNLEEEELTEFEELVLNDDNIIEMMECCCTCGVDLDMHEEVEDPYKETMLLIEKEISILEKELEKSLPHLFDRNIQVNSTERKTNEIKLESPNDIIQGDSYVITKQPINHTPPPFPAYPMRIANKHRKKGLKRIKDQIKFETTRTIEEEVEGHNAIENEKKEDEDEDEDEAEDENEDEDEENRKESLILENRIDNTENPLKIEFSRSKNLLSPSTLLPPK